MPTTEEFKVKLVSALDASVRNYYGHQNKYTGKVVVFDVTPSISESGGVDYEPIQIVHNPTSFLSYRGTPSRTFSLQDVKLISRTPTEARDNIEKLNTLRSWRMPYFGQESLKENQRIEQYFSNIQTRGTVMKLSPFQRLQNGISTLKERLGAPPEILYFSAYSKMTETAKAGSNSYRGNIQRVPVVLTDLTINYLNDVQYIPTAKRGSVDALGGVPFPVIMTIGISLTETHSPNEVNNFNLAKYANGVLEGF